MLRSLPLRSASKTGMSLDIDSIFTQGMSPLSPFTIPDRTPPSSYYSTDFSSEYDLPTQLSLDEASFEMFGGGDIDSPVLNKMDSVGATGELLSLEELTYDDYCSSEGNL